MLHRAVIKDLAFAALDKAFCLPVEIEDWAGKGLDRAHRADLGTAEGTADALFEFCASLVIEKRHYYIIIIIIIIISFADKIELAFANLDFKVLHNMVYTSSDCQAIRRLHLKCNLLRFMVWVNSIKFL